MTKISIPLLVFVCLTSRLAAAGPAADEPWKTVFHRQAARRFVFGNTIPLAELKPGEIIDLELMHPIMGKPGLPCGYALDGGALLISNKGTGTPAAESSLYVGGASPFASYEVDVRAAPGAAADPTELALEWATLDTGNRVQVVEKIGATSDSLLLRVWKDGVRVREQTLSAGPAIVPPCKLRVQLSGGELAVFAEGDGASTFLGRAQDKDSFDDAFDLRERRTAAACTFNVATRVPAGSSLVLNGAGAFLAAGAGQADIRNITHRDGSPYVEDNRLWFTFSVRGLSISSSCQGVMSLDPSTFDARLEGIILFDRGDGLLRNDYASHVFYDDDAGEWRAFTCCFSRSAAGRGPTGIATARSTHDPRRGVSVMREELFTGLPKAVEDPCAVYDADARRWRLLGTALDHFKAEMFESERWDGPYTHLAGPVAHDSTGTLIQRMGKGRYVFSGSNENAVFVYSYPDLRQLGRLNMDLPPFNAHQNARIWPDIVPLPEGFPSRYVALMMDRANYPGVRGPNWSYGALYLYTADGEGPAPAERN